MADIDWAVLRGETLVEEDFADLDDWQVEAMDPTDVLAGEGALHIQIAPAHDGLTLWHRKHLQAPVLIEYTAQFQGGDGVNDLNHFLMADTVDGNRLFAGSEKRGGVFRNYHGLRLYYAGLGVAQNTYNRFRRYPRSGPPELENGGGGKRTDLLLDAGEPLRMRLLVTAQGRVQVWKGNRCIFDYTDPEEPYTKGYFGLRSYNSAFIVRDFRISRLKQLPNPN